MNVFLTVCSAWWYEFVLTHLNCTCEYFGIPQETMQWFPSLLYPLHPKHSMKKSPSLRCAEMKYWRRDRGRWTADMSSPASIVSLAPSPVAHVTRVLCNLICLYKCHAAGNPVSAANSCNHKSKWMSDEGEFSANVMIFYCHKVKLLMWSPLTVRGQWGNKLRRKLRYLFSQQPDISHMCMMKSRADDIWGLLASVQTNVA